VTDTFLKPGLKPGARYGNDLDTVDGEHAEHILSDPLEHVLGGFRVLTGDPVVDEDQLVKQRLHNVPIHVPFFPILETLQKPLPRATVQGPFMLDFL
jgi:hypothetical protein